MSLHLQRDFQQDNDSFDRQSRDELEVCNRAPSKSDPLKIYVENKPLTDIDDFEGLPRIHRAVSDGNLDLLKELVESGTEDVNTTDPEGWPPLYTAIKQGKLDCAAYSIKKGAKDFYDRQHEEYQQRLAVSNRKTRRNTFA